MKWLQEYFSFTASEYRGAILLFLICLSIVGYQLYQNEFVNHATYTFEREQAILDSINELIAIGKTKEKNKPGAFKKSIDKFAESRPIQKDLVLAKFNPNEASEKKLLAMGLSNSVVKGICNFRKAGGKFWKKEDVLKVYTIDSALFQKLEPFIELPEKQRVVDALPEIELNTADTLQLGSLKGIGAFYARKIVEYRTQLGGFSKPEQLLEIWRMDTAVLTKNQGRIQVDVSRIRTFNINTISEAELSAHPYVSYKEAKIIVKYRQQHGSYTSIQDLMKTAVVDEKWLKKLEPYIKFE